MEQVDAGQVRGVSAPDEQGLIARAQRGDAEALAEIIENHQRTVSRGYFQNAVGDGDALDDAKDAAHAGV